MEYIKHRNEFYKKIELKDLDKKELIKLITEAVEINPTVIERRNSYPVYIDRIKPRYNNPITWTATCSTNLSSSLQ